MEDSNTVKNAEAEIRALGLPIPDPLDKDKEILWPENVADLSPLELAEHLTWWSGWSAFIRYPLARAETNEAAFEKQLGIERSFRLHKSEGDYKSVTELKASVDNQKDIQLMQAKVLEASATKKLLRALLEGYETKYNTISREITRRNNEAGNV